MYNITEADIEAVKNCGAKVFSAGQRFAVPLPKLTQPYDFINPKDAGDGFGAEHLRGDGNDVLLLNGVSDIQGQKIKDYVQKHPLKNTAEMYNFLAFLTDIGVDDMYASDRNYLEKVFTMAAEKNYVGFYTRRRDIIFRAARLTAGAVLIRSDDITQYAEDGALLIVPENGENARITNVAGDYVSLSGEIPTLEEIKHTFWL